MSFESRPTDDVDAVKTMQKGEVGGADILETEEGDAPAPPDGSQPEPGAETGTMAELMGSKKEQGGGGFSIFGLKIGGDSETAVESEEAPKEENKAQEEQEGSSKEESKPPSEERAESFKEEIDSSNGQSDTPKEEVDGEVAEKEESVDGEKENSSETEENESQDVGSEDPEKREDAKDESLGGFSLFGLKIGGESNRNVDATEKDHGDEENGQGQKDDRAAAGQDEGDKEEEADAKEGEMTESGEPNKEGSKGGLFGLFGGAKKEHEPMGDMPNTEKPDEERGEGENQGSQSQLGEERDVSNLARKQSIYRPMAGPKDGDANRSGTVRKHTLLCILCAVVSVVILVVFIPLLMRTEKAVVGLAKGENESPGGLNHHTMEVLVAQIAKHPYYAGPLFPFGKVTLRFDDDDRFLAVLRLEGLETTCINCKWTILEGTSCADTDVLGARQLYDRSRKLFLHGATPYTGRALYNSQDGKTFASAAIWNGYGFEAIKGHAVVIFQQSGSPLGCGILKRHGHPLSTQKLWANMAGLPMYTGGEISGQLRMEFFSDDSWQIDAHLEGLPAECFACGLRIHEGRSCAEPPGNDFWNVDKLGFDPWYPGNSAYYSSDSNGTTHHSFYLYTGYNYDDHFKRVVVFYDQADLPVACGELWNNVHHVPQTLTVPVSKERRETEKTSSGRRIDVFSEDHAYQRAGENIILEQAMYPAVNGRIEHIQV